MIILFQEPIIMVDKFFQDLEAEGKIGMTSEMNKECLWYCFSGMLQADCNAVNEHWNTHYIRADLIHYFFARISRCYEQSFVKCGTQWN